MSATAKKLASDEELAQWYDRLRHWNDPKRKPNPPAKLGAVMPMKWNASEFQVVSGYAMRVAKHTSLDEFKHFIRSGELAHPVKMTPAEMELLQGGSKATDWIKSTGWIGGAAIGAAGAACCDA